MELSGDLPPDVKLALINEAIERGIKRQKAARLERADAAKKGKK